MGLVEMRPRIQQEGKDHPYASCLADLEKVSQLVSLDTCAAMTVIYMGESPQSGTVSRPRRLGLISQNVQVSA